MAWYVARRPDSEFWIGPCRSREAAIERGKVEYDVYDDFYVQEAEQTRNRLEIITDDDLEDADFSNAGFFSSLNEENFGEDGEGGPSHWAEDHRKDLAKRLNETFAAWAKEHGYDKGFMLDFKGTAERIAMVNA